MTVLIGDVHGKIYRLLDLYKILKPPNSIILGDLGFGFEHEWFIKTIHGQTAKRFEFEGKHKVLFGNHDHTGYKYHPHSLGDFGMYNGMFFVRGARSIDKSKRKIGIDWFPDEELSVAEGNACLDLYEKEKPLVVISHEAPKSVNKVLFGIDNESSTARLLEEMLTIHKPHVWVFGHHHVSKREHIDGTLFICLAELQAIKLCKDDQFISIDLL